MLVLLAPTEGGAGLPLFDSAKKQKAQKRGLSSFLLPSALFKVPLQNPSPHSKIQTLFAFLMVSQGELLLFHQPAPERPGPKQPRESSRLRSASVELTAFFWCVCVSLLKAQWERAASP